MAHDVSTGRAYQFVLFARPRLGGLAQFIQPARILRDCLLIGRANLVQLTPGRFNGLFEAAPLAQFARANREDEVLIDVPVFRTGQHCLKKLVQLLWLFVHVVLSSDVPPVAP